jgi:tRNA (guanine-N7-)-methyltransferase
MMVTCDRPYFSLDPTSLFGRDAPLEVEIGAGRGDFIIGRAADLPQHDFLAIELAAAVAQLLALRGAHARLANLRVARMDARSLVNLFLPDCSVSAYHVYFPDPWPKLRHAKHRLFTPFFLASLRRTLSVGASLYVATDVRDYAESIFSMARSQGFHPTNDSVPGLTTTRFARKFIAEGRTIYARAFVR